MLRVVMTEDADVTLEEIIHYYLIEHSAKRAEKVGVYRSGIGANRKNPI
jgi:hypothetical protein